MALRYVFEFDAFLVGLLFGSLLNVCIVRLPRGESIVRPRSHCMECGHLVRWYDNIPLLSWVVLRARCRDCGARISWRYPAVELAVGLWFLRCALQILRYYVQSDIQLGRFGAAQWVSIDLDLLGTVILGFLLIGLMVMDWQTHRLPDAFTLTGTAIGFVLVCVQAAFLTPGQGDVAFDPNRQLRLSSPGSFAAQGNVFLTGTEALVLGRIAAIVGAGLLLLGVRWAYRAVRGREGMGLGDVKMLMMIAAFLGFRESLVALFAGAVAASFYALSLVARGKAHAATRLPFGSFLAVGGLVAALSGAHIVAWYTSLLLR